MSKRVITIKLRIDNIDPSIRPTPAQCANLINIQALDNLLGAAANASGAYLQSYMADGGYTGAEKQELGEAAHRTAVRVRTRTAPP